MKTVISLRDVILSEIADTFDNYIFYDLRKE